MSADRPNQSLFPQQPPNDVIATLADTIQGQAEVYGQTFQVLSQMREDNVKIIKKLSLIQKKVGARDNDGDDDRGSSGRVHWTENKLLMIFLILMALAMLVLAGVKVSEVAGVFKQAKGAVTAVTGE